MTLKAILPTLAGCMLLVGCSEPAVKPDYQASIRYTEHGVPHIEAADYGSLGFGIGYAQSQENLCTLAEQVLKLNGQLSQYFGPGNAGPGSNLWSDAVYLMLDYPTQAATLYSSLPSNIQQLMEGYVAGYNKTLGQFASPEHYPSPCRGADWVRPISAKTLLAYHLEVAGLASTRRLLPAIAAAAPPGQVTAQQQHWQLKAEQLLTSEGIGSNGWALGHERSASAHSLLLANPHFPWDGELRFFEQSLTIPGELHAAGVSMIGMPAILIGFNQDLGWTHTVSQSKRFTFYQLHLDPKNPMRYQYGEDETGQPVYKEIEPVNVNITVKRPDGSLQRISKTLYQSHYGPMIDLSTIAPSLGWNQHTALTFRDANQGNTRMLQQWIDMAKARSTSEFFQAFHEHQGLPWVNTLMISRDGSASYLDGSQVPQLSDTAEQYWRSALQKPEMNLLWLDGAGSILLPGHDPRFEWVDSQDAGAPGLVPFYKAPQQTRQDYVFNANSSHWLTNLQAPLEGYSIVYGPEQSIRSVRTRFNAQLISNPKRFGITTSDQFTLPQLQHVFDHNGSLLAEELLQDLVERCVASPMIELDGQSLDLTPACQALSGWDGKYQLSSRGAHVFREFLANFITPSERALADLLFATPFDVSQPADTPSGLRPAPEEGDDTILIALAKAMSRLQAQQIALDTPLGELQYVIKASGKHPIPVSGGYSFEGVFNMSETKHPSRSSSNLAMIETGRKVPGSPLTLLDEQSGAHETAAYRINYGSSFVMALQYNDSGPEAKVLNSYGQSHDPESVYFDDQTQLYSELKWRTIRFNKADVKQNTHRILQISSAQ